MSGQVDPSIAEEWFALVSRWEELESALDRLDPDDPDHKAKSDRAGIEFAEIKRQMDALISRSKHSRRPGSPDFVVGSIEFNRNKDNR